MFYGWKVIPINPPKADLDRLIALVHSKRPPPPKKGVPFKWKMEFYQDTRNKHLLYVMYQVEYEASSVWDRIVCIDTDGPAEFHSVRLQSWSKFKGRGDVLRLKVYADDPSPVAKVALDWWRSKRRPGWDLKRHLQHPIHGCITLEECTLARSVAYAECEKRLARTSNTFTGVSHDT